MNQDNLRALRVDNSYKVTNDWKKVDDQFNSYFRFSDGKGINNTAGFRPKSKKFGLTSITECAFCVLVTNFSEAEWPDEFDYETGIFYYYGDNRTAGKEANKKMVPFDGFCLMGAIPKTRGFEKALSR